MPPMSYVEQANLFYGYVAGYAMASGIDLWAVVSAGEFKIDRPAEGTRSHVVYRENLLDGPTFHAAMVALFDSMPTWRKAEPLGLLPEGLFEA